MSDSWSIQVDQLVLAEDAQFLRGTLVDGKGNYADTEVYVLSKDWKCNLYRNGVGEN